MSIQDIPLDTLLLNIFKFYMDKKDFPSDLVSLKKYVKDAAEILLIDEEKDYDNLQDFYRDIVLKVKHIWQNEKDEFYDFVECGDFSYTGLMSRNLDKLIAQISVGDRL